MLIEFPSVGRRLRQGNDMERIDQYSFYEIGAELSEIKRFDGDIDARDVFFVIVKALAKLNLLVSGKPVKPSVSLKAAKDLQSTLTQIHDTNFLKDGKFHFPSASAQIPGYLWGRVKTELETFEHVFRAELDGSPTYIVPGRGIYQTSELVENAQFAFPIELHQAIGDKALADYRSAGRCIAFNLPTAAAFHAVRAMEAMIEVYYREFSGKDKTLRSWHDYAVELDGLIADPAASRKPDRRTVDQIKQMKDGDRNPVMHPRVTLTLPEADAVFSATKAAIMNMALEVVELWQTAKGASLNLVPPKAAA